MTLVKTYLQTQELSYLVIRTRKEDTSFIYFILEANDGICFYSTLGKEDHHTQMREIEITCTIEYYQQVKDVIQSLNNLFPITILEDKVIKDKF